MGGDFYTRGEKPTFGSIVGGMNGDNNFNNLFEDINQNDSSLMGSNDHDEDEEDEYARPHGKTRSGSVKTYSSPNMSHVSDISAGKYGGMPKKAVKTPLNSEEFNAIPLPYP
eukprot:CAMPEP_0114588432 /NCGR_PEP_ID=MMETSP0125-20121206/11137_1 /TAXON_ID=485358 ORGANISM="Aristerostoma sp., Strain ATCC 50986" /NCGR_SAMPLE_ID=MMETSP0125 /ASSEMBLY_ACC=CAM_ASM_000245 /LENGTH=111 /DNA_ID=CAMNT_0001784827 /DNA_START=745 /DNA_END=1080 /DNA_ORIENTATION=+